jgi:hypothetical protein
MGFRQRARQVVSDGTEKARDLTQEHGPKVAEWSASARSATQQKSQEAWEKTTEKSQEVWGDATEKSHELWDERAPLLVRAKRLVDEADEQLRVANDELEEARTAAKERLETLGAKELELYEGVLHRFSEAFGRLKNVTLSEVELEQLPPMVEQYANQAVRVDFNSVEGLKGALAASSSGATAGVMTFTSGTTLATASTGTAIGSLSGAAATNATLAWLGGGTVASGAGGVAAGTAVLGGVVAAPALAVGGVILRHQGRKALASAESDALKAQKQVKEMQLASARAEEVSSRANQLLEVLDRVGALARDEVAKLEFLIEGNDDYATFSQYERHLVASAVALAKTVRAAIDAPVLDEDGRVTEASREAAEAAEAVAQRQEAAA